jgi:hypothetical protein
MSEVAPWVYVVDLDTATYNSNKAFRVMSQMVVERGLATESDLVVARERVEQENGSFDLMTHLQHDRGLPLEDLQDVADDFGRNDDRHQYLYTDAQRMFDTLEAAQTPFYILTKGGKMTQTAKLQSAGLYEKPHVITDNAYKSQQVNAGREPTTGHYGAWVNIGALTAARYVVAQSVFVVEDKPAGFEGLPPDCAGAWIVRGEPRIAQLGPVPNNVMRVKNLNLVTNIVLQRAAKIG